MAFPGDTTHGSKSLVGWINLKNEDTLALPPGPWQMKVYRDCFTKNVIILVERLHPGWGVDQEDTFDSDPMHMFGKNKRKQDRLLNLTLTPKKNILIELIPNNCNLVKIIRSQRCEKLGN